MAEFETLGVIGATSFVGRCLLPLVQSSYKVVAFSRQSGMQSTLQVDWHLPPNIGGSADQFNGFEKRRISYWICLAPIWVLPEYFQILKASGAKRVVALSSTSRFTKNYSSEASERLFVERLINAEHQVQLWAESQGVEWVIVRPTLIYGIGKDKNISEIIRLIRRFRFFPLLGAANGLRQPVHVQDVAEACFAALLSSVAMNKSYNISGREIITYKQMVERIFTVLGIRVCFLNLPLGLMRLGVLILSVLPRFRSWTPAMVERMNQDLVFDHSEATADFDFSPRAFQLEEEDIPY